MVVYRENYLLLINFGILKKLTIKWIYNQNNSSQTLEDQNESFKESCKLKYSDSKVEQVQYLIMFSEKKGKRNYS